MARQILAEEQNTVPENVAEDVSIIKKDSELEGLKDGVIVYADEMEKLFHEWDANGKNDLYVNSTLANRIRKYIDYQNEMDPLKKEMAARVYAPFKVAVDSGISTTASVYIDNNHITDIKIFEYAGTKRAVRICDFKIILMALDNPYAYWIDEDGEVDLKGYLMSIGCSYKYDTASYGNDTVNIKK